MIRRPPRSTLDRSSAASDVYKRQEGNTVAKQVDEVTGLSTLVVIDPKRRGAVKVVRPQVKLLDAAGNEVKIPGTDHSVTIGFPVGALIQVRDGQDLSLIHISEPPRPY